MTSETIKLNLIPGGDLPVLHSSQFDTGRALTFEIYDGEELFTSFDAYDISLHARKVDGTIIGIDTYNVDSENHQVIFFTTEQLTACAGKNICELVFTDPISGTVVGSCNFWLEVEGDPYSGGIDSASDIENLSTQIASIVDGQLENYYTKEEVDDQIETIVTEQVTPIVSGIVAEQVPPAVQAELGNYYTKSETDAGFYDKSEVDTLLADKADTSDLPDMNDYYDKDTTDTLLASKANTSTTYTKTEVDNLIAAIPATDITTEITTLAPVQTFNDGGDNIPLKSLVTEIVPIQSGSGVPSPSNVRPITGFDSVDVVVTGDNILGGDKLLKNAQAYMVGGTTDTHAGTFIYASGASITSGRTFSNDITFKENTQYTVIVSVKKNSGTSSNIRIVYTDETYDNIEGATTSKSSLVKVSASGKSIKSIEKYQGNGTTTLYYNECGVFEGVKTIDDFKPFGTIHTISLPETIYGGTANLVGGNGVKKYGYIEFDGSSDENWSASSGANGTFIIAVSDAKIVEQNVVGDIISNRMQAISYSTGYYSSNIFGIAFGSSSNQLRVNVDTSVVTKDLTTFKTWLSNNPLQVRYELATPTTFSFTPENIPTLSGLNNIYTDCGDIQSLEYFNNKADDIAAMISLMTRS